MNGRLLIGVCALLACLALLWWGASAVWESGPAPVDARKRTVERVAATARQGLPSDGRARLETPEVALDGPARAHARLEITVTRSDTGTPIPGLGLRLLRFDGVQPEKQVVRTDAEGRAVVEPIGGGEVMVEPGGARVTVAAAGNTRHALALTPHYDVRGIVVDPTGRPIAGASLFATDTSLSEGMAVLAATTGPDGRFGWPSFAVYEYVFATARGFAASPVFDFHGTPKDAPGPLHIVLRPATGVLRGVVVDAAGNPVPDAEVRVSPPTPPPVEPAAETGFFQASPRRSPRRAAQADDLGGFVFTDLPPGRCAVRARSPGHGPGSVVVELTEARPAVVRVVLGARRALHGFVRDGAGHPVAGAVVAVGILEDFERVSARSAADGSYRLDGVRVAPERGVDVTAEKARFDAVRETLPWPAGEKELRFDPVLRRTPLLEGVLRGADDGPLPGWFVQVSQSGGVHRTDGRGHFELRWEGEDPPDLLGMAPVEGGVPGQTGLPQLLRRDRARDAGRHVYRPDPERAPTASIAGRVRVPGAQPVRVVVDALEPAWSRWFRVEPGGGFAVGPLAPGAYRLSVRGDAVPRHALGTHQLHPHQVLDLGVVDVPAPVPLDLRITWGPGTAPRWLRTELRDAEGGSWFLHVSREGAVEAEPLPPGRYVLTLYGPHILWQQVPLVLEAGRRATAEVEVRFGRQVRFKAALPDGVARAADVRVEVTGAGGARCAVLETRAHVLARGGESCGLAPGAYSFRAALGERVVTGQFAVPPAGTDAVDVVLPLR